MVCHKKFWTNRRSSYWYKTSRDPCTSAVCYRADMEGPHECDMMHQSLLLSSPFLPSPLPFPIFSPLCTWKELIWFNYLVKGNFIFILHVLDCGCTTVEPLYGNSCFHIDTGETLWCWWFFFKGQLQPNTMSSSSCCLSPHLANPLIVKLWLVSSITASIAEASVGLWGVEQPSEWRRQEARLLLKKPHGSLWDVGWCYLQIRESVGWNEMLHVGLWEDIVL